ncbi:MAG: ATP-binding protein, partial [Leptospiraceae bacterium]|nr:ATP-binding protein [Leptospiraceae bacterium]
RKITYANAAFTEITGYTESEILGKKCSILQGTESDPNVVQLIKEALDQLKPIVTEIINYKKDGTKFWNLLYISPVFDHSGKLIQFVGVQNDITKKKEQELELIQAKEKAEEANRIKSEFIANMSHELRTPLNAVIGYSDLLLKSNLSDVQKLQLQTIYESSDFLLHLINDILDFSKIDARKLKLDETIFDLVELVDEIFVMIKASASEKKNDLIKEIRENLPKYIKTDRLRLKQVLVNLLNNAVKFTDSGKIILKLESESIAESSTSCKIKFSIIDNGIGIDTKDFQRIFTAFTQVDSSNVRKFGGSGLGLTISNSILEMMNSKIDVESELNKGSRFYFSILVQTPSQILNETKLLETLVETEQEFPKEILDKVLIVEDNKVNLKLAKAMMTKIVPEIKIVEAENGLEAIEKYKQEKPKLILMDIQMPIMDGIQSTIEIRKLEREEKYKVTIVAITAGTKDETQENCMKAGINEFLTKPIIKDDLKKIINKKFTQIEANNQT